jgi:hypothetical protein
MNRRLYLVLGACQRAAARTPLRFSLLAVLALLAIALVALGISYETNDDVSMSMIVAGKGFCPAPDEHLIFTNILIGRALKQLYLAWPRLPWYGCYLLLVHFLAQATLLYCVLTADRQRPDSSPGDVADTRRSLRFRLALSLVYFVVMELVLLNNLQFTSTAFLAAQAGIFLLWSVGRRQASGPAAALVPLGAAAGLIVIAGLIRFESLCMAALVAAPLAIELAWHTSPRRLMLPAAAATLAAIAVLAACLYNRAAYQSDPAWSRFYAYNQLRCKFNDYQWTSHTPQTAHVFSAVGWSKNDHDIMARWFFDDPVLYSEDNLRSVLEAYPWKTARLTPGYFLEICRGPFRDRSVWAALLALPLFVACTPGRGHARRAVLACAAVAVTLVVLISVNNKVPPLRTYFPLLSLPLAAAIVHSHPMRWRAGPAAGGVVRRAWSSWTAQPRWTHAVVVMLVVGVSMGVYRQCRRSVRAARDRAALGHFLADAHAHPRNLYIAWEAALPYEAISPLDDLQSWSGIALVNLTWTQRTPWQETIKRRFGISDLARAMSERDDIVLVASPRHRALFATYAKEHFQTDLEYVNSRTYGEKFAAGRFRPSTRETARRAAAPATH